MKRLLYWLMGYTFFRIDIKDLRKVLNAANSFGVRFLNIEFSEEQAVFQILTRSERKIIEILKRSDIEYNIHKKQGALVFFKKYTHRIGILSGILIFFLATYISPKFIWDINIVGLESLSEDYISELLKNEGVHIGAYSPHIDRQSVYSSIVKNDDKISWITVNFIGGTANVEVSERDYTEVSDIKADAANIIAKKDGQITETDIQSGKRLVKKGDIVKKGDVLVSGIYDTINQGTRYVYAEADVYAVVSDEFVIEVSIENYKKVYTKEIVQSMGIKLFEKNIIFYKNYSNLESNYDTICKEEKIPFLSFEKLPFSFVSTLALCYENVPVSFTEEEALEFARSEFYKELDLNTDYVDMISVEETYTIENSVLTYKAIVEAVENIALTSEFQIN